VEPIPNTPFNAISVGEEIWFIEWGQTVLSDPQKPLKSYDDCVHFLSSNRWDIQATFTLALLQRWREQETYEQFKKETK
jgi:hypothetical protein